MTNAENYLIEWINKQKAKVKPREREGEGSIFFGLLCILILVVGIFVVGLLVGKYLWGG